MPMFMQDQVLSSKIWSIAALDHGTWGITACLLYITERRLSERKTARYFFLFLILSFAAYAGLHNML